MAIERIIMAEGTQGPGPEGGPVGQPPTEPPIIVGQEIKVPAQVAPAPRETTSWDRLKGALREVRKPGAEEKPKVHQPTVLERTRGAIRAVMEGEPVAPETPQAAPSPETPSPPPGQAPPAGEGPPPPGQPPEGPRVPENPLSPDYLWSAEFRAEQWRVAGELELLEALPYEDIYDGGANERYLDFLYQEWKRLEALDTQKSYKTKPFSLADLEKPSLGPQRETYEDQHLETIPEVVEGETPTLQQWFKEYNELRDSPEPDDPGQKAERETKISNARGYLSRYLKEAKRLRLADSIDTNLKSIAKDIEHGLNQEMASDEILNGIAESYTLGIDAKPGVNNRIENIKKRAREVFKGAKRANPVLARLEGFSDIYIDLAKVTLTAGLDEGAELDIPIDGEFKLEAASGKAITALQDEGEIYWRPQYANYFTVYAKNKGQFDRAEETFMRWARTGLGKDPQEFFQTIDGFNKALTTAGIRAGPEMQAYSVKVRWRLMALAGWTQGSFFNELYKPNEMQQSLNYAAQHEAVNKMLQLGRTARGIFAEEMHKFAKDPKRELLFSPHGRRGQLMGWKRNAIEMESLQEQLLARYYAEAMGIALKGYNPDDPEKFLDTGMYERNMDELFKFAPDEYFENLYEGFTTEEQDRLYQELEQHPVIQQMKWAKAIDVQYSKGQEPDLTDNQKRLYDSWKSGELEKSIEQTEEWYKFAVLTDASYKNGESPSLTKSEQRIYDVWKSGELVRSIKLADLRTWQRLDRARKVQQYLEKGGLPENIKKDIGVEEAIMYEEAKNAVNTAYEVFGAMGDKAQRGGTVFLIDRQDSQGREFRDYMPDYWAERYPQFAENWVKSTYGGKLDEATKAKLKLERRAAGEAQLRVPNLSPQKRAEIEAWMNPIGVSAADLYFRSGQARRFAVWSLRAKGYEGKLWDFTLLKGGKPVDINTVGYTQYGDNVDTDDPVERYRYAAPENARILGYNTKGEQIVLVFADDGTPMTLKFDEQGLSTGAIVPLEYDDKDKAVIYKKPTKATIYDKKQEQLVVVNLQVQDRERLVFDNLDKTTKAQPMMLKRPRVWGYSKNGQKIEIFDKDGRPIGLRESDFDESGKAIIYDKSSGKERKRIDLESLISSVNLTQRRDNEFVFVEEVPATFDTATNHILCRWTGNPYPGYQEQWTGLTLSDDSFADARMMRDGLLSWEDAPPHAVQLWMVDPTLERVGHFDLEQLETIVVLASQEGSYISHFRIGDELHLNFFPEDAAPTKVRTQYILQDHGGSTKEWFHLRGQMGLWPDLDARRLGPFTPHISLHFAAMSQMLGAPGGAWDVFRMYSYEKYQMIGQFATEKWINQIKGAQAVLETVKDSLDEQRMKIKEALARKLNNEADNTLKGFYDVVIQKRLFQPKNTGGKKAEFITTDEGAFQKFLQAARESLQRWNDHFNKRTVLETVYRGERAPKNLEGIEIYQRLPDGGYKLKNGHKILNPEVEKNKDTGSSRHSNAWVMNEAARFLRSPFVQSLYADTATYYRLLDNRLIDYPRLAAEAAAAAVGKIVKTVTGWDWVWNVKENN